MEGQENFTDLFSGGFGAVLARSFASRIAFYAVPMWVGNTAPAGTTGDTSTAYIGLGTRIRFLETAYLVGEVTPRFGGYVVGDPEYAFSIEKRVGAHVFAITFANAPATSTGLDGSGFSAAELRAINRDNALKFLPRVEAAA